MERITQLSDSLRIPRREPTGPRFAAIDVGSNSLRLMIGEETHGTLSLVAEHGRTTRLAEGLSPSNAVLSMRPIIRTLRTMSQLLMVAKLAGVPRPRTAGTEALRKAANSHILVDLTKRRLGLDLEVLDPAHEANLTFRAVRDHLHPSEPLAIADLGGGSLELAGGMTDALDWWRTFPLGCIGFTEQFFTQDPPGPAAWERARSAATALLENQLPPVPSLVGCGGAFTSTAALSQPSEEYSPARIRAYRLAVEHVREIGHMISAMPLSERSRLRCISTSRAYLAPAGTAIIAALLELTTGFCVVSDRGLAWGLLLETWIQQRPGSVGTSLPAP